jgi:hypothetical protein
MNVLITATLLPSVVADIGGSGLMSWPRTAFAAASIIAATGTAVVSKAVGNGRAFCGGAIIYATSSRWGQSTSALEFLIRNYGSAIKKESIDEAADGDLSHDR